MSRRLKNRERQRRYRARKRLEADKQMSPVLSQPTIPQVELQLNGILNNGMTRVHCKRDWKKDARRAHICKGQEDSLNASVQSTLIINVESQTSYLPSGIRAEGSLERENSHNPGNYETRKPKLGRRDWKADANPEVVVTTRTYGGKMLYRSGRLLQAKIGLELELSGKIGMGRTDSYNELDHYVKAKDGRKSCSKRVDRSWSWNISPAAYEQMRNELMSVVASKQMKKKGHRRLNTIDTTYGADDFEADVGPRLVRSSGMRRDWSFEDKGIKR
ncbi:hypothetical protein REPUB_Repub07fG0235300 [Reevesia pubescens]